MSTTSPPSETTSSKTTTDRNPRNLVSQKSDSDALIFEPQSTGEGGMNLFLLLPVVVVVTVLLTVLLTGEGEIVDIKHDLQGGLL